MSLQAIKHVTKIKRKMRVNWRGGLFFTAICFSAVYAVFSQMGGAQYLFSSSAEHRRLEGGECPEPADPVALALPYAIGVLYLLLALATVADEIFCPCLDVIADFLGLSPDVAGATLQAAGGSAPELFTAAVGTFKRSDVGFGAIVGSAVFNLLFVVGMVGILAKAPMQLTWWPLTRDSAYYTCVLIVLAVFFGVSSPGVIQWWEALVLHLMYWLYVFIMSQNVRLRNFFSCSKGETMVPQEEQAELRLFDKPNLIRGSVLSLLKTNKSIFETAGTTVVTSMGGTIDEVFAKFDKDGNGTIDRAELKTVMSELGCELEEDELASLFTELDSDNNGTISQSEFFSWYLKSKERIAGQIDAVFDTFNKSKSGDLQLGEIKQVVESLGGSTKVIKEEVWNENIKDLATEGNTNVTKEQFKSWYLKSLFYDEQVRQAEAEAEAAEGLNFDYPKDEGWYPLFWYWVTLPIVFVFYWTLFDVRKIQPGDRNACGGKFTKAVISFLGCLAWMGIFCYFCVSWIEIIGATAHIPSVIMGLTFLAAGTSVPDMLSALIVARQGQGDQAVSSSIGSNVFDICIGLAFPWLLFMMVYAPESVHVTADSLLTSIISIIVGIIFVIGTVKCQGWKHGKWTGYFFFFLYWCFVAQVLAQTDWNSC